MQFKKSLMLGAAVAGLVTTGIATAAEQYIGLPTYRVGAYAAGGTGLFGGWIDYMSMVNERDGGVNGLKLIWEECETEYNNARGVECYERMKKGGPTGNTVFQPLSTGITYSVLDRVAEDKIPLVTMGYGRTDAADGRVFPWVFPLITTYWSQSTAKIKFIGMKEGGMDKLKGKKIVIIYHDSAYARRPGQAVWFRGHSHRRGPPRQRTAVAVAARTPGETRLGDSAWLGRDEPDRDPHCGAYRFPA